jgi:putative nucleotidyltransferase with HDIG domain
MIREIAATLWSRYKKQRTRYDFRPTAEEPGRSWVRWLIVGGAAVILIFLFPRGQSLQFADLDEGSVSTRRVVAPFDFEILKTETQILTDREQAVRDIIPAFVHEPSVRADVMNQLNFLIGYLKRVEAAVPGERESLLDSLIGKFPIPGMQKKDWESVIEAHEVFGSFIPFIRKNLRDIQDVGILNMEKSLILTSDRQILVQQNGVEKLRPVESFYDAADAPGRMKPLAGRAFPGNEPLQKLANGIALFLLRPNFLCDAAAYRDRVQEALSRVPLSSGFVYENEKVVDRNERITPEIRQKLTSLSVKMAEKGMREKGLSRLLPLLGRAAFVFSLFFLFGVTVFVENRELLLQTKSVFLFCLVVVLVSVTTFFMHRYEVSEYLVPAAAGAMLLAAIFDARIGFTGTAVISVLVGGIWGNVFALTAVSFFVGVVAVIVIKRVRSRSQLIEAVLFMIGAYVFSITFMGLISYQPFGEIFSDWKFGTLNGLFTPIVVYGLLALFESTFDIATDFSLLELSNLNHPLLKQLSVEAPGTYHHSILVGNLAEAAAQAVAANSLLARVGSYYHDIGKIDKSEYFVENQVRGKNPHKKLTPRMSALILANHVKKGMELGEKHRLPTAIQDIMTQHHGRSIMDFFFQKALNLKAEDEDVNEEDYRYPGPKPQSKESAIVMLADAVEAASRALKQPTHSRLKGLIEALVNERFKEGELDESPLTLRDLEKIKEAFLTILAGTFHTRIEYPDHEPVVKAPPREEGSHAEHTNPQPDQVRSPE